GPQDPGNREPRHVPTLPPRCGGGEFPPGFHAGRGSARQAPLFGHIQQKTPGGRGKIFQGPGRAWGHRPAQDHGGQPCVPSVHPEDSERKKGWPGCPFGGTGRALWRILSPAPAPAKGLRRPPLQGSGFPGHQPIGGAGDLPAHAYRTPGRSDSLYHRSGPWIPKPTIMKILVTGGLGYIGSHTVVELQEQGHQVVIVDNLSNTSLEVLGSIEAITGIRPHFEQFDLRDKARLQAFFQTHGDLDGLIHFAASKAVGESVENPLLYYENNLGVLVYILQELEKIGGAAFIFSSSCTVYGQAETLPITEEAPVQPAESPYGNTKQVGEEIIRDAVGVNPGLRAIALRYFNPIGAHPSAKIGELPLGVPQNLVPFITQTGIGLRRELSVFGDDY